MEILFTHTDRRTIGLGSTHEPTGDNKEMVKGKVKGENMDTNRDCKQKHTEINRTNSP